MRSVKSCVQVPNRYIVLVLLMCTIPIIYFPSTEAALNIHRRLGEALIRGIRDHIFVDEAFIDNRSVAFQTCSSLEGRPCERLTLASYTEAQQQQSPYTLAATGRSVTLLEFNRFVDKQSIPLLEEGLGDDTFSESFATATSHYISWLLDHDTVWTHMFDVYFATEKAEDIKKRREEGAQLVLNKYVTSLPGGAFWKKKKHRRRKLTISFYSPETNTHMPLEITLNGALDVADQLEPSSFVSENQESKVRSAIQKEAALKQLTLEQQLKKEPERLNNLNFSKVWASVTYKIGFKQLPFSTLPEFFGTNVSNSNVSLRWVGKWRVVLQDKQPENTFYPAKTLPRNEYLSAGVLEQCAVLEGVNHALLFSEPLLVSALYLDVFEHARNKVEENQKSQDLESHLFVEGFCWTNRSPNTQNDGEFFSTTPLRKLQNYDIRRVWTAELDLDKLSSVTRSTVRTINVIHEITGSSYKRIDGIRFLFTTGTTSIVDDDNGEPVRRQSVVVNSRRATLPIDICLRHLAFRKLTRYDHTLHQQLNIVRGETSDSGIFYNTGIVMRPSKDDNSLFNTAPLPPQEEMSTNIQVLQKYDRKQWETSALDKIKFRSDQRRLVNKKKDYHTLLVSDIPVNTGLESGAVLPSPEMSSDGVVLHWDRRRPLKRVTILGQEKIPIEAPIRSLTELYQAGQNLALRPDIATQVKHYIVSEDEKNN